jgi:hypothetical protein
VDGVGDRHLLVLREIVEKVEQDDRVQRGRGEIGQSGAQVALDDAVDAEVARGGDLFRAGVDAAGARIAEIAGGPDEGAVAAAEIEDLGLARGRKMVAPRPAPRSMRAFSMGCESIARSW